MTGQGIGGLIVGFAIPNVIYVGISKLFDRIWSFLNHIFCYAFVKGELMLALI